mmetsp:Transcript_12849/g.29142  ORF Transcript_12849/g.29142 Transcript_12849/m.29142 type:complete len:176 (-) Transcript_12849:18-545(-)
MWNRPHPEVSCVSSSVESFYRGVVAGGIFGIAFPAEGAGLLLRLASPFRPALLAGSWCFLTSLASCELTRRGCGFPWNGTISGLFSGYVIGAASRWPRESIAWTMVSSSALSVLSHYAMEGQQKEGTAGSSCDGRRPFELPRLPAQFALVGTTPLREARAIHAEGCRSVRDEHSS